MVIGNYLCRAIRNVAWKEHAVRHTRDDPKVLIYACEFTLLVDTDMAIFFNAKGTLSYTYIITKALDLFHQ